MISPLLQRTLAMSLMLLSAVAGQAQSSVVKQEIKDRQGDFINEPNRNSFDLRDPASIEQTVEYDPLTDRYIVYEKIGSDYFRTPTYMTFDEYVAWRNKRAEDNYFRQLAGIGNNDKNNTDKIDPMSRINPAVTSQDSRVNKLLEKSLGGKLDPIGNVDIGNKLIDRLFGGTKVEIKPQGNLDLTFGGDYYRVANPNIPPRARQNGGFFFQPEFQVNLVGQIGEKLKLNTNYNTRQTFRFDQIFKMDFNSANFGDDDILKSIEAGNVTLPLRSQLIQGAQSLFGIKARLQFGHLNLTLLGSMQNSQRQEIQIQGGAQEQQFRLTADQYEENRHFLLTHFNRDQYEAALENLPQIKSLFNLQNIEVWVTNQNNDWTNTRVILALSDLGEYHRLNGPFPQIQPVPPHPDFYGATELPNNWSNNLYEAIKANPNIRFADKAVSILQSAPFNMVQGRDFEVINARKLEPTEYELNPMLGTLSLKSLLRPDQVLAVSFNYTYRGENAAYNGNRYKVGEFRTEFPEDSSRVLITKLLKSTTPRVDIPMWDLMMKNIYNVGAYQADSMSFKFDILYQDPGGGDKRFLPEQNLAEIPLIQLFNMDRLNVMRDPQPDGRFDYLPGITIRPNSGRIVFPVLEPFGSSLTKILTPQQQARYMFQQLYDSTLFRAQEFQEFNRFVLVGTYRSSVSSEISLGTFNLPRGSVVVSAGGRILQEGADYDIDYSTGRIKILNDALLQQGAPIRVSFEDNQLFGTNQRNMVGVRAEYALGKTSNIGATYLRLWERPFTQKVNFGEDPINNRIYGLDYNFTKEAPLITRLMDALPGIQTKAPSSVTFQAETAVIDPGHNKIINIDRNDGGVVYVDDFEGSILPISLTNAANKWVLSSIPGNDQNNNNPRFVESSPLYSNNRLTGVNRALVNWRLDIYDNYKTNTDLEDPYTRRIQRTDLFPKQTIAPGEITVLRTFDVHYVPDERGPYNFDVPGGYAGFSAGLFNNGKLIKPESRWGGIMRELPFTDFEAANVEFIEFWLLDPFIKEKDNNGKLFINLGQISEDVLPDGRQFYENALPGVNEQVDLVTSNLGRSALNPPITFAFDNGGEAERKLQDVGFDGWSSEDEQVAFADWLQTIQASAMNADVKERFLKDPAGDDFVSPLDIPDNQGFLNRMKLFNNPEGNTPVRLNNNLQEYFPTQFPDQEDLNNDRTLNQQEAYYQYEIPLEYDPSTGSLKINQWITDSTRVSYGTWYRFKVPIDQHTAIVGGMQGFRSIRFMRMYFTEFEKPVTLRFGTFELVRNQWRRYKRNLNKPGVVLEDENNTLFDVNAVNIEENSNKFPFNYVLPKGIYREQSLTSPVNNVFQNEQSMSINLCGLRPNNARAVFKLLNMDMRVYKRMKMFVHASSFDNLQPGAMSMFVRLGSDFEENYYEYEYPLTMSDPSKLPANPNLPAYADEVWLESNKLDLSLTLLRDVKEERNAKKVPVTNVYSIDDPDRPGAKIRVKGNPNLGVVKGVMVGIRNNDEFNRCVEIWLNELRLTGLDERGGFAGLARTDIKLADVGLLTAAGSYSTIGFGGLDKRLAQRQRESILEYGVTGQLDLGRFLPQKVGLSLPFFAQYTQQIRSPQFDPYDFDIELKDKLRSIQDRVERDSVRRLAQTAQTIRSFNFTNVRIQRQNNASVPRPWDISNFSATYAYTETDRRDPIIERNNDKLYRGGIDYSYNAQPKHWQPFKSLIKKDKYVKFLTEFNVNPIPSVFGVNNLLERQFVTTKYRFAGDQERFNTFFNKRFTWDRNYDLQWDLTKSLRVNFDVNNRAVIDEPYEFQNNGQRVSREFRRDSIVTNLSQFGRTKNYAHNLTVDYTLPFKHIPYLEFIKATARYGATYDWGAASLNVDSLGNVIQNTQTRQLNGDLNFAQLYDKIPYLKKINNPKGAGGAKPAGGPNTPDTPKPGRQERARDRTPSRDISDGRERPTDRDAPQNTPEVELDPETGEPVLRPTNGTPPRGGGKPGKEAQSGATPGTPGRKPAQSSDKNKERQPSDVERAIIRPLLSLRSIKLRYNENFGSVVPGFMPQAGILGQNDMTAPGLDYAFGLMPDQAWLQSAANNNWISRNPFHAAQTQTRYSLEMGANAIIEPVHDFRLEMDINKKYTRNHTEFFLYYPQSPSQGFESRTPIDMGSYSITYLPWNTSFVSGRENLAAQFQEFMNNRAVISRRYGTTPHTINEGYIDGYGKTNQDVIAPAFLATYTGRDPNTIELDLFKQTPRPNWRLTYNGLSKLKPFQKKFQSINISHSYKSMLTVNQYMTNPNFLSTNPTSRNDNTDYYARFEIPALTITEQFAPLIGVDVKLKNDMGIRAEYKRGRTLGMSFSDYQLNEQQNRDFVFGFSYRMKNVDIPFLTRLVDQANASIEEQKKYMKKPENDPATTGAKKEKKKKGNNLNLKADVTWRDDITLVHQFDRNDTEAARGTTTLLITPSAEYMLSKKLTLRLFFDYNWQRPHTSQSFQTTNARGGLTVRFNL